MPSPIDPKVLAKVAKYVKAFPHRIEFTYKVDKNNAPMIEIWESSPSGKTLVGDIVQPIGDVFVILWKAALHAADVKTTRAGYKLPTVVDKKPVRPVATAKTARAALGATKRAARIPTRKRAANGRKG